MGRRRYLKACGLIMTVGVLSIALVKITANSGINNQANYQSRHLQQTTGGISFLKEKVKQRVAAGANFVSEEDEVRRGSQHSSEVDQLQQLRESRLKAETSTFVGGADYERDFHGESVAAESDYQPVEMILPDHPTGQENKKPKSIILPERIVHLDLKGAAPKVAYLKRFFALLNKLGATGILLEYEDVFPWNGELSGNRNGNAYSLEDVRMIIKMAKDNQLKIIPLIQTWGHMEWLLKSAKFSKLREAPKYPQVVCPNHPDTFPVIKAMVDQILAVHKDIDSIHIGCDEAYYVGEFSRLLKNLIILYSKYCRPV